MSHQEKVRQLKMICKEGMTSHKTVKSCKGLSHKANRKGRGYYIRMPKYNSVDWLVASRRVERVELHNSTASGGTKKKGGVLAWLKGL